jgi:glycine cleavage system aminomethyltransferase T
VAPAVGSKLAQGEMPAGEITSAVFSPRLNEVVALAYVRTEVVEKRTEMQLASEPAVTAYLV